MTKVIAFDVYGTLVNPLAMEKHVHFFAKTKAAEFALLWRQKQLEFALRRSVMKNYKDFDVCTLQALQFSLDYFGFELNTKVQNDILAKYEHLEPFCDVIMALEKFGKTDVKMVAFTNGVGRTVERLLHNAGIYEHLHGVISVDSLQTFKPDPVVYHSLSSELGVARNFTWLVSSNSWDVIGAKSAGLKAAWIKRSKNAIFDPWECRPDLTASDLNHFYELFSEQ